MLEGDGGEVGPVGHFGFGREKTRKVGGECFVLFGLFFLCHDNVASWSAPSRLIEWCGNFVLVLACR